MTDQRLNRSQLQEIKKQMERRKIENNNIRIEYLRKEREGKKERKRKKSTEKMRKKGGIRAITRM